MQKILALIPARSGSKGIPNKNIRLLNGKPMLAYSIEHGLASKYVNRVIVSTDSTYYASVAKSYGAEIPFLRPEVFAQDDSTDLEVFLHALKWLKDNENYVPDICVHLRPTHPIRNPEDIDNMIQLLIENQNIESIRTVSIAKETPFKMWFKDEEEMLKPVINSDIKEAYNMPRQKLPKVYVQNACIDVVRTHVIQNKESMTGEKVMGYIMEQNFDIDNEEQFMKVEAYIQESNNVRFLFNQGEVKTFCFDIDGVIASLVPDNQYNLAKPECEMIKIINRLYDKGHYIILFTARGSATGIDWKSVTKEQMKVWGVKYHELLFKKPAADFYIDDKLMSITKLRKIISEL